MKHVNDIVTVVFVLIILIPLLAGAITQQTVNTSGVFSTGDFTLSQQTIDWGTLQPSETKSVLIGYEATNDLVFNVNTGNYVPPESENYLTLDYTVSALAFNFTLAVNENVVNVTDFSFDIFVIGEQTN